PAVLAGGTMARRQPRTARRLHPRRCLALHPAPAAGNRGDRAAGGVWRGDGAGRRATAGLHQRHRRAVAGAGGLRAPGPRGRTRAEGAMSRRNRPWHKRLLPSPPLSVMVLCFWLLMNDEVSAGQLLLGVLLAIAIPPFAARLD